MSFLSQCIFYLISSVINTVSDKVVSESTVNAGGIVLIGVALAMSAVGFVAFSKVEDRKRRYLDIPLVFVGIALDILIAMLVPEIEIVGTLFTLIPGTCCLVREIKWLIDVLKKRRKPQKKNAIVLIAYILIEACLFSINFVDFEALKNKPTAEEIDLVNSCYIYTESYLTDFPTDEKTVQEIADITAKATEKGVFKRAYGESDYFIKGDYNILHRVTEAKDYCRKKDYADVVTLRLKTLIALKDYEGYTEFFVKNCNYLYMSGRFIYLKSWKEDNYKLTEEDFDAIILGYEKALALCDNDNDRLDILTDICSFYDEYEPDTKELEKYEKMRSDILDTADLEELVYSSNDNIGYMSEKLAVE